jgi:hypothetical protein
MIDRIKAEAERKMAIVDALKPQDRAVVHEIGLHAFSRHPMHRTAYRAAKKRAGIKTPCRATQDKRATALLATAG